MADASARDFLSDVLSRIKLEESVAGAFDARGDFSVELGEYTGIKLHLILKGDFWLRIKGERRSVHVQEGDCIMLTDGRTATVSKSRDPKTSIHRRTLAAKAINGVMTHNGGGEFFGIGIHFVFSGHLPSVLFSQLPALIKVPSHHAQSSDLRYAIEKFRFEFLNQNLGRSTALCHLAPIILVQILRSHAASTPAKKDWLFALSDPKLSSLMEALHRDPQKPWSLKAMAEIANMSRSSFAVYFRRNVGLAPMEYLTHWRIQVAGDLLAFENRGVSETAELVGYGSESAFSSAFTRIMKCRPGRYARLNRDRQEIKI